jgi:hypothetical protein
MHIRDFHLKFIACTDECDLLGALRRLSRIEDPQAMRSDDHDGTTGEWIVWSDSGSDPALSLAGI